MSGQGPSIVSFIVRDMGIFPELLLVEHPLKGLQLPCGDAKQGEDPRRAALRIATSCVDLANFSWIRELRAIPDLGPSHFFLLNRSEMPGALGYWRHKIDGTHVRIKWSRLDGHIRLAGDHHRWLAAVEPLLLDWQKQQ